MAFGRGHATFTIDTLKLQKDSLPAAVNEPPPVFPVSSKRISTSIDFFSFQGIASESSSVERESRQRLRLQTEVENQFHRQFPNISRHEERRRISPRSLERRFDAVDVSPRRRKSFPSFRMVAAAERVTSDVAQEETENSARETEFSGEEEKDEGDEHRFEPSKNGRTARPTISFVRSFV